MTVRTNALQICDRCQKPFTEKNLKAGDAVPVFKQKGLVVTETLGSNQDPEPKFNVLFSFDDICPDCQTAVTNLLAKIRLDAPAGKKGAVPGGVKVAKKRQRKTKTTEENLPKTEEYTEKPAAEAGAKAEEEAKVPEEPEAPEKPTESSGNGKGNDNGSSEEAPVEDDDSHLVTDPETGDKYDPATGEVVSKGQGAAGGKHPF